jgi:hypothetical protein
MEKKLKTETKKATSKISYEELEAYAAQTVEQAKRVHQENVMLKEALDRATYANNIKEIELALKCLDHAEMFSTEFIDSVVSKIEELLTPTNQEEDNGESE